MQRNCAIVVGAGLSGLFAAKVLAAHFQQVILIERFNDFHHANNGLNLIRKGIPQAHHLHVLLQHGQDLLKEIFPDISNHIAVQNCEEIDWSLDTKWHNRFGVFLNAACSVKTRAFSRQLLDRLLIEQVSAEKNVVIKIAKVESLLYDKRLNKIIGVELASHNLLYGDLIIDARGRASHLKSFFSRRGLLTPQSTVVKNELAYASRFFAINERLSNTYKQLYVQVNPEKMTKGCVIAPIENNKMIVTLIGIGRDQPPAHEEGFIERLTSLAHPEINNFLHAAIPISGIKCYRNLSSVHHHFGQMRAWPRGLIALGDAICVLNPIYGQGMTVAIKQIILLKKALEKTSMICEHKLQQQFDRQLFLPWMIATAEDKYYANQKRPYLTRIIYHCLSRVLMKATQNKNVHEKFLRMLHMLETPGFNLLRHLLT